MFRKVRGLLLVPFALIVVLVIRALRPLVLVRFKGLPSYLIGHFAANTEVYLCERDAGLHGRKTIDIFYHSGPVSNDQLKKMWDRTLHVSRFASLPNRLNRWLPGGEKYVVPWRDSADSDNYGLLPRSSCHLAFTEEEERLGKAGLRELGITDGSPFVCFDARDPAYKNSWRPGKDWSHHDYRDSSIHNYLPAAEELARRHYFAVRMGSVVREALYATNDRIIDYATNGRTDFLDIYLGANCKFFLSGCTGLYAIPMIFRRPIAYVNYVPLFYAPSRGLNDLIIPKKLWLRAEQRFLTFREALSSEVGKFFQSEQYEKLGIDVVENTPEEIRALAVEMDERINGTWQTSKEDEERQVRFWSLFEPSEYNENKDFLPRIGAEFLRQNSDLLD